MTQTQIDVRLGQIQKELEHWAHVGGIATLQTNTLINELCDMRDAGLITQTQVSWVCFNGHCHCYQCTINGE